MLRKRIIAELSFIDIVKINVSLDVFVIILVLCLGFVELLLERLQIKRGLFLGGFLLLFKIGKVKIVTNCSWYCSWCRSTRVIALGADQ